MSFHGLLKWGLCLQDTSAARAESYMIAVITDLTWILVKRNGDYGSHESTGPWGL